jgi:hypothetical protein
MENLSKEMDNQEKFVLNDNGDLSVENSRERFLRVSSKRVTNVVDSLRLIDNIGRQPEYYEYSEEDIEKMFSYIRKAVDKAEYSFKNSKKFMEEFKW